MGWRGVLRTVAAAAREAEREAQRRARAAERAHKRYVKEIEAENARAAVEAQAEFLADLAGAHRSVRSPIPWAEVVASAPPPEPERSDGNERMARRALEDFRPSVLARLTGAGEKERAMLLEQVARAREADERAFQQALADHEEQVRDWKELVALGKRILSGDKGAWLEALRGFAAGWIEDLHGHGLGFGFSPAGEMVATFHAKGPEVVPTHKRILLKTGRMSERPFPRTEAHELYLDYLASSSLRIAQDVLATLPLERAVVNVHVRLVDEATGHLVERCVLSVLVPRATMEALYLLDADPSAALSNFVHRSGIRKGKPLAPVEPLASGGA